MARSVMTRSVTRALGRAQQDMACGDVRIVWIEYSEPRVSLTLNPSYVSPEDADIASGRAFAHNNGLRTVGFLMNLHEYQAKQLFADYGIPVPRGVVARTLAEAVDGVRALGGESAWVVKAQVHAGGRGKGGGIRIVPNLAQMESAVRSLLGTRLRTPQTTAEGLLVNVVWIEPPCTPLRELYLGALIDRASERIVFMASSAGGMDIEHVAATQPEQIFTVSVDPAAGLQAYQTRRLAFALALGEQHVAAFSALMMALYRLFIDKDLNLVEINPLVITAEGTLLALDAKISVDDNALYRQKSLAALHDPTQEDAAEHAAHQHGLNYITLDGDIACMVNGAGLAMATMDLIKLHGGEPANFLDVGGGTTADKVAEAFKLIVSDPKVKAILVNIFGGIVRCDLIAAGIIKAVREVGIDLPVVVRLEGTNAQLGQQLLADSGLAITAVQDLTEAAQTVVAITQNAGSAP